MAWALAGSQRDLLPDEWLSAQKWGSFTVTGNDEYKATCVKLAAQYGLKITNQELQEAIKSTMVSLNLQAKIDNENSRMR